MKMKCLYCGSHHTQTVGGENGNPFDRRPEKTVCLDCGMTLNGNISIADIKINFPDSDKESMQ